MLPKIFAVSAIILLFLSGVAGAQAPDVAAFAARFIDCKWIRRAESSKVNSLSMSRNSAIRIDRLIVLRPVRIIGGDRLSIFSLR